jgi:hypothetical protein
VRVNSSYSDKKTHLHGFIHGGTSFATGSMIIIDF